MLFVFCCCFLAIDAFELWCWRRLLRVSGTVRRSNQSILKEISPEYSMEALMLKLKLQHLGHLMWRTDSLKRPWCWERSKAGGEGDDRGWDGCMASPTQWTWVWASSRSWWWTGAIPTKRSTASIFFFLRLYKKRACVPEKTNDHLSLNSWLNCT